MKKKYSDLNVNHEIETGDAVITVEMDGWLTVYDISHPRNDDGELDYSQTIRKHVASTMLHSSDAEKLALIFAELVPILEKAEVKSRAAQKKYMKEKAETKPDKKKPGPKPKTKGKKKPGPKPKTAKAKKPGPKKKAKK